MADDLLTAEQRETYLEALREGETPAAAAELIGFTGTKLRGLRRRDDAWAAQVREALADGRDEYVEKLSAAARARALDDERRSDRLLEVELATHVPGYEHLRRDRMHLDGKIEHGIVLSPGWIEEAPDAVLEWLAARGAAAIDAGEVLELGPGDDPE